MPISVHFHIHFRDRLILRCFPVQRNPVTFGFFDSYEDSRYSYQHSHSCVLQVVSQPPFSKKQDGLLPVQFLQDLAVHKNWNAGTSASIISSDTLLVQFLSISELLRFLERMAASKPTCWLSCKNHFLRYTSIDLWSLGCQLGLFPFRRWTFAPTVCFWKKACTRYSEFS